MLITFEGIDGSGKSTQVRLLKQYLHAHGVEVLVLREPGGAPLSEQIRALLLESKSEIGQIAELLLFSASRAELVRTIIQPAIERHQLVILDRFYDSTTAYQGYGRGIDLNLVHSLNRIASLGIEPQLTFYLDVPPEVALVRKYAEKSLPLSFENHETTHDRMERSGLEFYRRVREGYKTLVQENAHRFVELNALQAIDELHKQVVHIVRQRLPQLRERFLRQHQ